MIPKFAAFHAHGHVLIIGGDGPVKEADTLQCCHCQGHWIVRPGSGRTRGYCMKCKAVHCGQPGCWECRKIGDS